MPDRARVTSVEALESFRANLIDAVAALDEGTILARARVQMRETAPA